MPPFALARRRLLSLTFGLLCSVSGSSVWAQVLTNPTAMEFTASPDHDAVDPRGNPLLSHYEVQYFMTGAAQPFQSASLGKPQPGGGGLVRISLTQIGALPSPGVVYQARVAAIGPGGATNSSMSNQFMFDNGSSCSYPLSPATQQVSANGGQVQVTVNAPAGCAWTASSSAGWLQITGGSGNGFGIVTANADANASASVRRTTITVGGQSVEVVQDAGSGGGGGGGGGGTCTVDIQPQAPTIDPSGGIGSLSISSAGSCQWTATSDVLWIAITAQTGGGSGWVSYNISPNPSASQRTGTVRVNSQSVVVTQLGTGGGGGGGCSVGVSPNPASAGTSGGTYSLTVSAGGGCSWSTSTNVNWITITAASGAGSGWVSYNVAPNAGAARAGQIMVGNQSVTINQAGPGGGGGGGGSCTAVVTPPVVNLGASGAVDSVSVSAASGCSWSATSNVPWIIITALSGSGSGWVSYQVLPNTTGSSRSGTIVAAGQTVTFTQAATGGGGGGGGCAPSVSPQQLAVGASFGTASFTVSAPGSCSWTGTSGVNWITVTAVSGQGDGWVSFNVADNFTGAPRSGHLIVAGQTVWVNQDSARRDVASASCPVAVSSSDIIIGPDQATSTIGVTSAPECAWAARSGAAWLTIVDGASGSGTNTITLVPVGETAVERSTTVIVGDQTVTVTQRPR